MSLMCSILMQEAAKHGNGLRWRNIQRWARKGFGKTTEWHPLGFGIPCEPHQVATADAGHRDLRSASQPQIGLSCHRFPVASIKTAMVRVLSFVLPCHGCWQIGVEGVWEKAMVQLLGR